METKDYTVLLKAIELGSLTKASTMLGYSPSAGSHIIEKLEQQLGISLLDRSHSGVSPTKDALVLLPYIHTILDQQSMIEKISEKLSTELNVRLNVGSISSVAVSLLPEIIDTFHEAFPRIEITIFDGTYEEIEYWLQDGTIDCGFLTYGTRGDFSLWPLYSDYYYVVMPTGHPLTQRDQVHPLELRDYRVLIPGEGLNYEAGKILKVLGLTSSSKVSSSRWSDYSVLNIVRQGRGITLLPELLIHGAGLEGIEARPLSTREKRTICLAINNPSGLSPNPIVQQFIDFVTAWATKH